ncbi:hypothetical protein E1B28_004495 [Marasmius oreades]|uniref:Uncharacterized protein n=1 Tax=Marasmius oreades TaxID=181124 RepID=A0A9P7UYS1_9AGAR|nr:uncharacterized protein E1B28_004495 [Marasmius oreades]KAG7097117.1 hypothetical protein E1B28_004495 [Marasmius oreades]
MNNRNALQQRQVLGGVLSGIFGGAGTVVSQVGDGVTSAIGGVTSAIGSVTSAAGGVLTPTSIPTATKSSTSTTPTVLTTISTSAGRPSISPSFSSTSSPTSSSSTSSSAPISTSVFETTSDGVKHTVTAFVTDPAATASSTPPLAKQSFLQNKPLSGFVFALCGIVGLVLIILVATFAFRRRRKRKLENEAISYDPGSFHDDLETRLVDGESSSDHRVSSGHNGTGPYGTTYALNPHMYYQQGRTPAHGLQYSNYTPRSPLEQQQQQAYGTSYNVGVGAPLPPYSPNPGSYSSELYRSTSRGSGHSVSPPPPLPTSLLNGGVNKSPLPAAVRPPTPPQLPSAFGDNGSIAERQNVSPIDLKVANQ